MGAIVRPGRRHATAAIRALAAGAIVCIAILGSAHSVASRETILTPEQEAWLDVRDRTIVLGTDNYRPYVSFDDRGDLIGITGDYLRLIEERLDITIDSRELPGFSEVLDAAAAREVDVVPNVVFSDDRDFLVFTDTYITLIDRIIVRIDAESDYMLADLGGKRLASVDGYAVTDFIDDAFPEIEVVRVSSEVEGLRSLSTGAVDVLVADLGVVSHAVQEEGITNLKVAGTVDSVSEQRFGVRSDEPILRDILDIGLATITESERDAIRDRWVQLGVTEENSSVALLVLVGLVAVVSAIAAVAVFAWNRTLRRNVNRHTEDLRRELEGHERTELQRSRLALAIAQAVELVLVADADWTVRYLNPTYERVSGFEEAHLAGCPAAALFADVADRDTFDDARVAVERVGVWQGRLALRGQGDRTVLVEGSIASFTLPSGEPGGYVGTLRDSTREEHLQSELQRTDRLRAVGTLAAGIAHDFNNLLTPILSGAELAAETDDDVRRGVYLRSIQDAALRATDLVRQVQSYSREQRTETTTFDVVAVVDEACELISHHRPADVVVEVEVSDQPVVVRGDPSQFHRLVMNLLTNALQAMEPAGGRLRVELDRVAVGAGGDVAQLVVSDTGIGIDDAVRDRIFEPYYSTRAPSGGTGLGLFTVVGIIDALEGDIDVVSERHAGTSVYVTLPIASGDAVAPDNRDRGGSSIAGRQVLLVDDDDMVLGVLTAVLRGQGHDVTSCRSGAEALDVIDAGQPFDLLVTDLGMPGIRGDELARIVQERCPDLPVIVLTGHHDVDSLDTRWSVLAKPVTGVTLSECVREATSDPIRA